MTLTTLFRAKASILLLTLCVAACAQEVKSVTMQDSQEHSFSVDVPKDWNVTGGVYRFTFLEPRLWVDMKSPDGKTEIRLGDPDVLRTYQVPNPTCYNVAHEKSLHSRSPYPHIRNSA